MNQNESFDPDKFTTKNNGESVKVRKNINKSNYNSLPDAVLRNAATSREEFEKFLLALHEDFKQNGEKWENNSLASFLEALSAYFQDIDGYYRNSGQNVDTGVPSWQLFQDTLRGARMYE